MLISIALGLSVAAVMGFFFAWLGERWNRTKSDSWLLTRSSTEGYTDTALTASKIYRDIIRHPRGHRRWGMAFSALAVVAWMGVILQATT